MQPRVVPWTGFPEWLYVADRIFSKDAEDLAHALLLAKTWLARGSCPPAVETTISIVQLQWELSTNRIDGRNGQLALAACLVRFVNEVVDPLQQGTYALPVSHLAERRGLSRILVDIRHSATHDYLPSLETLCIGAELALDWLREHYWDVQRNYLVVVQEASEEALRRFSEGLITLNPLATTVDDVARRCLQDLLHLDYSPDIQTPFLLTLLESPIPIDSLTPLLDHVARKDDSIAASALGLVRLIRPEEAAGPRFSTILATTASHISTVGTLAQCVKTCFQLVERNGASLLKIIAQHHRVHDPPRRLCELIEFLRSPSDDTASPLPSEAALVERTIRHLAECDAHQRRPLETAEGWTVPDGWRPVPFGCSDTFNPMISFRDLYNLQQV